LGILELVRRLSPRAEFAVVLSLAFGLFIFTSVWSLVAASSSAPISEEDLRFLVVYELITSAALLAFLSVRGWTAATFGLKPTLEGTLWGAILVVAVMLVDLVTTQLIAAVWPQAFRMIEAVDLPVGTLDLRTVVLLSVVNGLYEELFVCGYVVTTLGKRSSAWMAINVSVTIRFLYHLYQGPVAVLSIIPTGLMFAYVYARTGRLWPLIVAHAALDFFALVGYAGR
jgi:membrane protease YdiL (CAAX protease family)